jgi:cell division ATPase FtsA
MARTESYDLVVYGGTSSGVIAAYTAAREGLSVALVERTAHVGGLTTSGIGNVDIGWATTVGGYTAEFLRTVGAHYGTPHKMQIALECKIAEKVFKKPVRIGYPKGTSGIQEAFHKPSYATGIGLLHYAARQQSANKKHDTGAQLTVSVKKGIQWFKDMVRTYF